MLQTDAAPEIVQGFSVGFVARGLHLYGTMASWPPVVPTPTHIDPIVRVDAITRHAGDEERICFVVDGPPEECGRTTVRHCGAIVMRTTVAGLVSGVERTAIRIDDGERALTIKTLLPGAVDLAALRGRVVSVEVTHTFERRQVSVDAVIHDAEGRALLWARDGALPRSLDGTLARVRVSWGDRRGPRLVFATDTGITAVQPRETVELTTKGDRYTVLTLRVCRDAASFVLVRR